MIALTAEETRRHIHFKVASRELHQDLADAMLRLLVQDPSLDYAALRAAALKREMPDVVFHTSALRNAGSISALGLLAADPADGHAGLLLLNQPTGVYASATPDLIGMWTTGESVWGIWAITGAASLPHRQDPLNPEHFVIETDVPRSMVTFCGTASLDPHHHHLELPAQGAS
jgi:hypothetical protein